MRRWGIPAALRMSCLMRSRFGGFQLHRRRVARGLATAARAVFSISSQALPAPKKYLLARSKSCEGWRGASLRQGFAAMAPCLAMATSPMDFPPANRLRGRRQRYPLGVHGPLPLQPMGFAGCCQDCSPCHGPRADRLQDACGIHVIRQGLARIPIKPTDHMTPENQAANKNTE